MTKEVSNLPEKPNNSWSQLPFDYLQSNPIKVPTEITQEVIDDWSPVKPTEVFNSYWYFAAERQRIFFKKLKRCLPPWTDDQILDRYKFTNAYRASDRVSQYLIKHVIYRGDNTPQEVFFRVILFKMFNRIETWELLEQNLGSICYAQYTFNQYDAIFREALAAGKRIFSAAYIMPSGTRNFG